MHMTILETVVTVASSCSGRSFAQSPKVDDVDLANTKTRTADHVVSVDGEPLFVVEDKTPSSFPTLVIDNEHLRHLNILHHKDGNGRIDYDEVECPVSQLCMYMFNFGLRYGVLTNYQNTWFVKLVKHAKSDKSGILITDYFSTIPETEDQSENVTKNPGGWSRSQALLWFCKLVVEDENRILNDGDSKEMTKKMITSHDKVT